MSGSFDVSKGMYLNKFGEDHREVNDVIRHRPPTPVATRSLFPYLRRHLSTRDSKKPPKLAASCKTNDLGKVGIP